MHEVVPGARASGQVEYRGVDIYDPAIDPAAVRRTIGMVFQQPNPFPTMSIFDNVAAPARFNGLVKGKDAERELVERCLRHAALWDEVKDKLATAERRSRAASSSGCASPGRWRSSRSAPDGRAVLGARSGGDAADRGAHAGAHATTTRSSS